MVNGFGHALLMTIQGDHQLARKGSVIHPVHLKASGAKRTGCRSGTRSAIRARILIAKFQILRLSSAACRAACRPRRTCVLRERHRLRICGIAESNVRKWGGSSKGYWRIAGPPVLGVAQRNTYWEHLGLKTLTATRQRLNPTHGIVLEEARKEADDLGLPYRWLNEQASVYISGEEDVGRRRVFDHPGLRVMAASPAHVFAMRHGRPGRATVARSREPARSGPGNSGVLYAHRTEVVAPFVVPWAVSLRT